MAANEEKYSVEVTFYSYFRERTGCDRCREQVPAGTTLGELVKRLCEQYPGLAATSRSMLAAVGVEYQRPDYRLQDGDEVALFPPVQGG